MFCPSDRQVNCNLAVTSTIHAMAVEACNILVVASFFDDKDLPSDKGETMRETI
jgi:hypothetical protein